MSKNCKRGDMRLAQALAYLGLVIDRYHEAMRQLYEGPYETDPFVDDAAMFLRGTIPARPHVREDYARRRRAQLVLINSIIRD